MKKRQQKQDKLSYTCTDETTVKFRVASHSMFMRIDNAVEQQFRRDGKQVDPPQYTITMAGGGEEEHDHDEKSIEDAPPEEQEQWGNYLDTCAEIETEAKNRSGLFIFREGLECDEETAQSGDWIAEYEKWLGPVPEDPDERFIIYVETVLLKTPGDQVEAMGHILALMMDGVPEDVVGAAREMFRDSLAGYATSVGLQPAMGKVTRVMENSETAGDGEQVNGGPDGA